MSRPALQDAEVGLDWAANIDQEALWWKSRFGTFPALWEFRGRQERNDSPEGNYYHLPELAELRPGSSILDVGCGPITAVSTANCPRDVTLHGCDPLAPIYNVLLEHAGINPQLRTRQAFCECLADIYDADSFDCVTVRNALDHGIDPVTGLMQLLYITKTGGFVRLEHHEREGRHAGYRGLHQWDFFEQDGSLFFQKRGHEPLNVSEHVGPYAVLSVYAKDTLNGRRNVVAIMRKIAHLPVMSTRFSFSTLSALVENRHKTLRASGLLAPYQLRALMVGAGEMARAVWPCLNHSEMLVAACIDERPEAGHKLFMGSVPVLSLEKAVECRPDVVLLALRDVHAVLPRLAALGIPDARVVSLDFADWAAKEAGPAASAADRFGVLKRLIHGHPILSKAVVVEKLLSGTILR